jgi:hypothetical protein
MVSPLPPSPTEDEDPEIVASTPPSTHANGLGISPVAAMRISTLLTRDNIGWSLVAIVAADYFGITDQLMSVILGVC